MASDSQRLRWLTWLPVAMLLLGIVAQTVLMQTVNANPQAGSGFTMFSTVDFTASRRIVATSTVDGNQISLVLPDEVIEPGTKLLLEPTDDKASDFASTLLDLRWTVDENGRAIAGDGDELDGVSVDVRGLIADGRTLRSELLASGQS